MQITKEKLVIGTRWNWIESIASYSAALYTLKLDLKFETNLSKTITSTADSTNHEFTIEADDNKAYSAGWYVYHFYAVDESDATNIISIESGVVSIDPNVTKVDDARSHALKMVKKIETVLLTVASQEYDLLVMDDGKQISLKDSKRLRSELKYWQTEAGLRKGIKRRRIQFV